MPSTESPQPRSYLAEDIDPHKRSILEGKPSNNYMHRQMQLVFEMAVRDNPGKIIDKETLDQSMQLWSDTKLSIAFNRIAEHPEFKTHPRFQGNIANITLEDVEFAVENDNIPED